ncbi:MAG: hypothetical protein ABI886_09125 [Betaproteobacteria bacterium]
MLLEWIDFILETVLWVIALFWIFEGTRQLAAIGGRRIAFRKVALGSLICLCISGIAIAKFHAAKVTRDEILKPYVSDSLSRATGAQFAPEKRVELDLARARYAYLDLGELQLIEDGNGDRKHFVPTQEDVFRREAMVAGKERVAFIAAEQLHHAIRIGLSALISALIGWIALRQDAA